MYQSEVYTFKLTPPLFRRALERVFQHDLYKVLILIAHPPIKVAVRDVTFLVRMLKAHNSSNSSSTESCFFTEQSLCFPSRSTERRIWFCSTGESTYHVHGFFLLCLPVRETETIISGRESSWDTRKAFQMSLSQKARLYCLTLYCKIRGFKMMQFLAYIVVQAA